MIEQAGCGDVARGRNPVARCWTANVLAMLLAVGAIALVDRPEMPSPVPIGVQFELVSLLDDLAGQTVADCLGLFGLEATSAGTSISLVDPAGESRSFHFETLLGQFELLPQLCVVLVVLAAVAGHVWALGPIRRIALLVLAGAAPLVLTPLLGGLFAAIQIAAVVHWDTYALFRWLSSPTTLAGFGTVGLWCLVRLLVRADGDGETVDAGRCPRPASLWAAVGGGIAVLCVLIVGGLLKAADGWEYVTEDLPVSLCGVAVAMVLLIIVLSGRWGAARWAWAPLLVTAGTGGISLVLLFGLTVIGIGDERTKAFFGERLDGDAARSVGRRSQRPLTWLCGVFAVVALSGAVLAAGRAWSDTVLLHGDFSPLLDRLSLPWVLVPVGGLGLILGVWEWAALRRTALVRPAGAFAILAGAALAAGTPAAVINQLGQVTPVPWPEGVEVTSEYRLTSLPLRLGPFVRAEDGGLSASRDGLPDGEGIYPRIWLKAKGFSSSQQPSRCLQRCGNWYVLRYYLDARGTRPASSWYLQIHYYTAPLEPVPHLSTPPYRPPPEPVEIDRAAITFQVAGTPEPWDAGVVFSRVRQRAQTDPGNGPARWVEYEIWCMNGRPSDREAIRAGLRRKKIKYLYFARIAVSPYRPQGWPDPTEADRATGEFLKHALPAILRQMPTAAQMDQLNLK